MFAYCMNNPVNNVDPTGQLSINLIKVNPADMVAAFDYYKLTGESIDVGYSELKELGFENVTIKSTVELNLTLKENNILSKVEKANFLAQCAYETNWGMWLTEIGDESYFADKSYGYKYRGAGYIQITWDYNYSTFANVMGDPEIYNQGANYVATNYAWTAAGWFWNNNNINDKITNGATVTAVTRIVNGGIGTAAARQGYYDKIYSILR